MMSSAGDSLPKQCGSWGDLKAAYRLLSNPQVQPAAIQMPHRKQTLSTCADHAVVLCVQDTTDLDLTTKTAMRGRGKLGGGTLRGLLQHTALALAPADDDQSLNGRPGRLLGILHQQWAARTEPPADETLRQLQQRRTDADVWLETANAVAQLGPTPTRLIHVGDRHSDIFRFMEGATQLGHGFVVRARYDRTLAGPDDQAIGQLFETLADQPEMDRQLLTVH